MCLSDGSCSELNQGSKHYLHVLTSSFRICKRCYSPSIRVQQVSMEINIDPNTWVQFGGGHGGHNMLCPPHFFLSLFGEVSKTKVMFVTFCVKSFSC